MANISFIDLRARGCHSCMVYAGCSGIKCTTPLYDKVSQLLADYFSYVFRFSHEVIL